MCFNICSCCGAHLDPGESCDCQRSNNHIEEERSGGMSTDLIIVRQLPVIEDQLRTVREHIQARVSSVLAMECTEETCKEVKKARSELNAQYRDLERRRKEVKAQIEAPYKKFEEVYKAYAGDLFVEADKTLAQKISAVENGLRQKKAAKVRAYFEEYRESLGIPADLATYDRAGIVVTLSASEKSLKTQAKTFLDRINEDLELIATQEHKDEILVEYRKTLNASQAVTVVSNRHAAIERQRKAREEMAALAERKKASEEVVRKVVETNQSVNMQLESQTAVMAPIAVKQPEPANPVKMYETAFKVTGSIDQLKALKKFLEDGGYTYEQLK